LRRNRGFLATTVAYHIEGAPKFRHVELHATNSISRTSRKTRALGSPASIKGLRLILELSA
jgi:hypothetical protein